MKKPIIDTNGNKFWYLDGKDGPVVKCLNGNEYWYLSGRFHREGGPAVELANGSKHWYLNGTRHREDGPAIEWSDGDKWYFLNGKFLTKEEFINYKRYCKICNNQLRHMKAINEDIFYCERCKR